MLFHIYWMCCKPRLKFGRNPTPNPDHVDPVLFIRRPCPSRGWGRASPGTNFGVDPGYCVPWQMPLSATTDVKNVFGSAAERGPPSPFTRLVRGSSLPFATPPNRPQQRVDACAAIAMLVAGSRLPFASLNAKTLRSGPTQCLVGGSRLPLASLQTPK
jgi:hypothetical protein